MLSSFRNRTAVFLTMICFVAGLATFGYSVVSQSQSQSEALGESYAALLSSADEASQSAALKAVVANPAVVEASVAGKNGRRTERGLAGPAPSWATHFGLGEKTASRGTASVTVSVRAMATVGPMTLGKFGVALLALFFGMYAGLQMYLKRSFRPFDKLVAAMTALSGGSLKVRVAVEGCEEFEEAGAAFNKMAAALERSSTALGKSEGQHREIAKAMGDGLVLFNKYGTVTACNSAAETILGFVPKESGDLFNDFWKVPAGFEIVLREKVLIKVDNPHLAKRQWLTVYAGELPDEGTFMALRDATADTLHQERMRLLSGVFEHAREGILIADAKGAIVEVNDAFEDITGWSKAEAVGQNPRILKSDRHDPAFFADMWRRMTEDGHWSGEVWNRRKDGSLFVEHLTITAIRDETGVIARYVGIFSDVSEMVENQKRLERQANHDALTGLPNRTLFADRLRMGLSRAKRNGTWIALGYLDLDGFKPVNDTMGHAAGDALLIKVAERLKFALRDDDTVARVGGDEFVMLMNGLVSLDEVETAARRVLTELAKPFMLRLGFDNEREARVTGSLGVVVYPLTEGDSDQLIKYADQSMYKAKKSGKNQVVFWDGVEVEVDKKPKDIPPPVGH